MKSPLLKGGGGILLAAAVVAYLVYADGTTTPDDGRIHLRFWTITGMTDVVPYFARSYGNARVVVETTPIPWQEHEKKILTAIVGGNPPDVINQVTPVAKWASRMALLPLDAYLRRDGFDSTVFFPSLWDEMRWRGHIYAIPVYSGSYALFYNRTLFREAGLDPDRPPRTWEEVWEFNERLTVRDERGNITRMGFIPNYGNIQTFMLMAWELGTKFVSRDGLTVTLVDSGTVTGLNWVVRFYERYPLRDVASFQGGLGFADQHGFIAGKIAMMVLDSSFPDQIRSYKPGLDYGVAMIPTFEGRPTASVAGSWWLAIPRGAKHPGEAWEFIRHAVSKESQLKEVEMTAESLFPANRFAAMDPRFMKNHEREIFVRMMDQAHSPSVVPLAHDVFWREMTGAQERSINRLQSPAAALRQGEQVLQSVLNESIEYDSFVRSKLSLE